MNAEEILPVLLLQLRNNFALTDEEAQIISSSQICGVGYGCTVECFEKSMCKYYHKENGLNLFNSVMYTNILQGMSAMILKPKDEMLEGQSSLNK